MPAFDEILSLLKTVSTHELTVDENASPKAIRIHTDDLLRACHLLHENSTTFFDMLVYHGY